MNYYIQGNEEKADKIREAFEKLGYDTSRHLFNARSVLYFTLNGEIRATTCNCTPAIIKTHPDYKELELPIEPCFKVGDWVVFNNSQDSIYQISKIMDSYYMLTHTHGGSMPLSFSQRKFIRLWTIADAKDGDVLATSAGAFVYNGNNGGGSCPGCYCGINTLGGFQTGVGHHWTGKKVYPATKEQRDLLFQKMKEAGYQLDERKKELRKIQPHYDISNFKPFDKVLGRNSCRSGVWRADLFSHIHKNGKLFVGIGYTWEQCIPYNDDTKHLLGTTDMPSEEYINW